MLRRLRIENLVLVEEASLELAPGLNVLTGETGAGKTIFAEALGLLLGAKGDASLVGPAGREAYVEAELELVEGLPEEDDSSLARLLELRPDDEPGLLVARRVFSDGRTRAYAWGRAIAREDLADAMESLVALSGQFEQRRLARPAYQLDLLDAFVGDEQARRRVEARRCWVELTGARRRVAELERGTTEAVARAAELRALVDDAAELTIGQEAELRAERERLRHVVEIGAGLGAAIAAISPDDGEGAASLATSAQRALEEIVHVAADLEEPAVELRELASGLREVGTVLRRAQASLEVDPQRLELVESELDRIATLRRRYDATTLDELIERREAARGELDLLDREGDPLQASAESLRRAEEAWSRIVGALSHARRQAAPQLADAVSRELHQIGLGEGELRVEVTDRVDPGPTGLDDVTLTVRLNEGLPFAPVAQTASGGELSRIALCFAAVAGGPTMVFDEIDAGVGGTTAHRVAEVLLRLAERSQIVTITHLPQIANVAERHFRVEKVPGDPTHTRIEVLDDAQRRDELGRMLGGEEFVAALTSREP